MVLTILNQVKVKSGLLIHYITQTQHCVLHWHCFGYILWVGVAQFLPSHQPADSRSFLSAIAVPSTQLLSVPVLLSSAELWSVFSTEQIQNKSEFKCYSNLNLNIRSFKIKNFQGFLVTLAEKISIHFGQFFANFDSLLANLAYFLQLLQVFGCFQGPR